MSTISPTLGINQRIQALRAQGRLIHHFGFGEAPFPVPARLAGALRDNVTEKAYLPVAGLPALRDAVLADQARLTGCDPERFDVLIGPGSKLLLFAIQLAIPGDLLLPVPSWVSYTPQAALLGQHVLPVPTQLSDAGYGLSAGEIERVIQGSRAQGRNPSKLLINFPNNPAGLSIDDDTLQAVADVCRRHGVALISDEIYGRVSYDQRYRSAASLYPEGTLVTSGLSKHLSLGGWRLGIALVPRAIGDLFARLSFIASETWSCVAAPVQIAALQAYAGHEDIEACVHDMTAVHAIVNGSVAQRLRGQGVDCPRPQGGFYSWPDFGPIAGEAFASSEELAAALLDEEGIATLPGTAFGERPEVLKLRLASCDYDGEHALTAYRRDTRDVGELAPSIGAGMDGFERFIARHRR